MDKDSTLNTKKSFRRYAIGFGLSIIFTLIAYFAVVNGILSGQNLIFLIASLALLQAAVQLIFFLHLSQEKGARWNLMMFLFMAMVVIIVVAGSLWIMSNLSYHGMSPDQTDEYLLEEEGIKDY